MARIPESEIERIKREVSLERLVEASGVELKKKGKDLFGRCPFHAPDETPSFSVTPAKNLWNCLGACQEGGDVFAWVMKRNGVSFRHAYELLREGLSSLAASPVKRSTVRALPMPVSLDADDQGLKNQAALSYYHAELKRSPEAMGYAKGRGIDSPEAIEKFKLGYANRTLGLRLPNSQRVTGSRIRERLQRIGILRESGHEHFAGSLVIPIVDEAGNVVEMYGRKITPRLRPGTAKHLYLPEECRGPSRGVWNWEALVASKEIILCEALIDALTFWCAGFRNVTSAYGAGVFTDEMLAAMKRHGNEFLEWSGVTGCTDATIETRRQSLRVFLLWCAERSIAKPQDLTLPILERYQRWLYHYRKTNGAPLGFITQRSRLVPLKTFFKWLTRSRYILYNPASELVLPRPPKRLPRHIFTLEEIETIMASCDLDTPQGVRDRAILELLYSSGVRRMEAARLKVYDLDLDGGALLIREGKGRKDRMAPIGERACQWLAKYILDVRPQLVVEPDEQWLFLTDYGEPMLKDRFGYLVRGYIERAGYTFPGSCHLFRHAMATHMLENGADIRFIQAMLGHAKLTTTEIYTQVSILKLKEIHSATHPARPGRARRDAGERGGAKAASADESARSALLAALEAEGDDDIDADGADRGERRDAP